MKLRLTRMSHSKYAEGTDRWTDGRTSDRYITLSTRRSRRNKSHARYKNEGCA